MSVSLVKLLTDIADAIREKKGTTGKINAQNMAFEIKSIEPPLDTIELKDPGKYDVKDYKYAQVLPSDVLTEYIKNLEGTATEIHVPEGTKNLRTYAVWGSAEDWSGSPIIKGVTIHIPTSVTYIDDNAVQFIAGKYYEPTVKYAGTLQEWYNANGNEGFMYALVNNTDVDGYYLYINNELVTEINSLTNFTKKHALGRLIIDKLFIPNGSIIESDYAFAGISAKEIIFEGTINGELKENTFSFCKFLTKLILPSNITTIPKNCFSSFTINEVIIPEGVTTVESYSFSGNNKVKFLVLPTTLTTVGGMSFYNSDLTVVINATTPPTATGTIFVYRTPTTIYIPAGTLTAYQTATNWSQYSDLYVEMNEIALNIQAEIVNNETYQYSLDGGQTWSVFASSNITLEQIALIKFKNTSETTKLLIGKTAGATDIGSITDAELTYATEGSMTIYLRLEEITA